MTTTIDRDHFDTPPDRPWRRRFHHAGMVALVVLLGAIALRWVWTRLQAFAPDLPDVRFVDGVALLLALIAVVAVVRRV
ncbi:MAG: hypothetical protein FJX66_12185 [Alphaproteobacteria bacterium]|nr:hypothetical protein [Alphaproteobacteria bacterium]